MKRKEKVHEFGLDHRKEFDEVFVAGAFVHIERMSRQCYWIGIYGKGLPAIQIFTGQHRGTWFFNLAEDRAGAKEFRVQVKKRPRPPK